MNNLTVRSHVSILAVVALAGSLWGCTRECGAAACLSSATQSLSIPASPGAQLKACRNSDCATATLSTPDGSLGANIDFGRSNLVGALTDMDDDYFIKVSWGVLASPANGDRFTLTATNLSGGTIASVAQTATYTSSEINGQGCGLCESASLTAVDATVGD
jgi:hypothetical protein